MNLVMKKNWVTDYSITWKYIVEQMDKKFGIPFNSKELFAMGEIEAYIKKIWNDFFNEKLKNERRTDIT